MEKSSAACRSILGSLAEAIPSNAAASPRGKGSKVMVTDTFQDQDDIIWRVRIRTAASSHLRDVGKLCLLEASDS